MKTRILSLMLAALMLTAALAVPAFADEAEFSRADYEKLERSAKFTASFFWGDGAYDVRSNFFSTAVQMYPENVIYHSDFSEFGEYQMYPVQVGLLTVKFENALGAAFPYDEPLGFVDKYIRPLYEQYYDAQMDVYYIPVPQEKSAPEADPELCGFTENGDAYCFWFAKREHLDLPADAYPKNGEDWPSKLTYEGREYTLSPVTFKYETVGDLMNVGYCVALSLTEEGVVLVSSDENAAIPAEFLTPPPVFGDFTGDGKTNAKDVTALMKALVSGEAVEIAKADFTGDGKVNAKDVIAVMKHIVAVW